MIGRWARAVGAAALALVAAAAPLRAQGPAGLLPGDHWAVEAVWRLEELGLVRGFLPAQRAVPISAVAAALVEAKTRAEAAGGGRSELVAAWYDRFAAEFGGALAAGDSARAFAVHQMDATLAWESVSGRAAPGRGAFAPKRTGAEPLPSIATAAAMLDLAGSYGGRVAAQARPRVDTDGIELEIAELSLGAGPWTLSAGRQTVGYGWAERGGLALSGAVLLDRVELATLRPLRGPWLLRHLGPVALDAFGSSFSGPRHPENQWFWGGRIAVQPHPRFTLAVHRATMFGGDSTDVPVTARTIFDMLIGDAHGGSFENQVVSVSGRLRLPTERWIPLTAYLEWGADDGAGAWRDVPGRVMGVRIPAVPGVEVWSVGVEYATFAGKCCGNPEWHRHGAFSGSWSGEERPLGHPLGGHGEEISLHSTLVLDGGRLRVEGEAFRRDRDSQNLYVPGREGRSEGGRVLVGWQPTAFAELFVETAREQGSGWRESAVEAGGRVFLGKTR